TNCLERKTNYEKKTDWTVSGNGDDERDATQRTASGCGPECPAGRGNRDRKGSNRIGWGIPVVTRKALCTGFGGHLTVAGIYCSTSLMPFPYAYLLLKSPYYKYCDEY